MSVTWKHGSIPPCINGSGWWWCDGIGYIFLAHLGPLVPTDHRLDTTAYLNICVDNVHPFMTKGYQSTDGYFQQNNFKLVSWTWKWVHCTPMAPTVTRSNRPPLRCGGMGDLHHVCSQQICKTVWCCHVNMDKNIRGMFPTPFWSLCHEKLRKLWR